MPKRKRRFEVFIEAKLSVDAFDGESAQRKAERSLARGKRIDADVAATGEVWSYEAVPAAEPTTVPAASARSATRRGGANGREAAV
ncbi:MAG: hypothetical protein M3Q48_12320 [Actinomycetota bacterium]|nr:hypothetical protein [Actinomycetota bacterium]